MTRRRFMLLAASGSVLLLFALGDVWMRLLGIVHPGWQEALRAVFWLAAVSALLTTAVFWKSPRA